MGGLRADELASMRAAVASFMTDSALNTRTNVTSPCLVEDTGGNVAMTGIAPLVDPRKWKISEPYGTDMDAGDVLTITDSGSYTIISMDAQATDALSCDGFALQTTLSSGLMNLFTNESIQFLRTSAPQLSVSVNVAIYHASTMTGTPIKDLGLTMSDYIAWYDPSTVKTNGVVWAPVIGDFVNWSFYKDAHDNPRNLRIKSIVPEFNLGAYAAVFSASA